MLQNALTSPTRVVLHAIDGRDFACLTIEDEHGSFVTVHFDARSFDLLADLGEKVFAARAFVREVIERKVVEELTVPNSLDEPTDVEYLDEPCDLAVAAGEIAEQEKFESNLGLDPDVAHKVHAGE